MTAEAAAGLARYLAELDRWRRSTNLTGRLTAVELVRHALESAFGERLIPHSVRVVDIGSGAGFPGVPLAIVRPDIRVTAVEPRRKRAGFLRHMAARVPLPNWSDPAASAAQLAPESADVATSRAVGRIAAILGSAPFLKPGGAFLAWTTEPQELSLSLSPVFTLERQLHVPQSRRKKIALFRKTRRSP